MSGHRPVPARTSETVNHSGGKVTAMTDSLRNEQTVDENSRLSLKEVIWGDPVHRIHYRGSLLLQPRRDSHRHPRNRTPPSHEPDTRASYERRNL